MRSFSLFACTALALIAGACSVQEMDSPEFIHSAGMELEFIGQSGELDTKSEHQSDNSILWSRNDAIKVYYGASEGSRFTAINEEDHFAKATFRGYLEAFTGLNGSGDYNYFWGVYPYDAALGCDGDTVVVKLPEVQMAKAGSFADNTNVTIAKSPGLALSFFNTCSWLRFSVARDDVRMVIFSGNDDEDIAGIYKEAIGNDGLPTPPKVTEGEKVITLKATDGECLIPGQYYFITLLPQTLEQGFSITYYTDTEHGTIEYPSSFEFKRREYRSATNWDQYATFTSNPAIRYTSTDGEAVWPYDEFAFDAPILSNKYIDGQGTITFFGELTNVGFEAFRTCRTLKTISFPETVTSIGGWSFFRCSSLESVTFPQNLTSIDECAFFGTALKTVSIPASVENIAFRVFSYCSNLTSISVNSGNHVYNSRGGCNAIIETNDKILISGCKNTRIPDNTEEISRYAFMGLNGLTQISIPEAVGYIGENAFFDCTGMTRATFLSSDPPGGGPGVFNQCYNLQIYVPSASFNRYQRATPWKDYSKIMNRT